MKYLTISGDELKSNAENLDGDHYVLYEGDGELLGMGSKPGMNIPDEDKKVTIHCRDLVEIIEINKKTLVENCEANIAEKAALGYRFLEPHYSNMVPINFKFIQRLSVSGSVGKLWFYLKV